MIRSRRSLQPRLLHFFLATVVGVAASSMKGRKATKMESNEGKSTKGSSESWSSGLGRRRCSAGRGHEGIAFTHEATAASDDFRTDCP
ncbi:hypothetical protein ACFX15_042432 [Malus domestica]